MTVVRGRGYPSRKDLEERAHPIRRDGWTVSGLVEQPMKRFTHSLYAQVLVAVVAGALLGHFNPSVGAAWLEQGGVYALANTRGGGEFGPKWHESARKQDRQRAYDDFSVQLMDAAENYYSFEKSDVISIKQEYKSLMPDTYGKLFSESELNDLVAYMASLRGTRR